MSTTGEETAQTIHTHSALEYGLSELADVFNLSFANYIVPVKFTPGVLAEKIRVDSLDLEASRVIVQDRQPVGIAMIARRGRVARLAGMGIIPDYRSRGLGRRLLNEIIDEEKQRGTQKIFLEVILHNDAGMRLYQRAGFTSMGRLMGFVSSGQAGVTDKVAPVELREVGRAMIRWAAPELPWQLSGETILQLGAQTQGYRLGDAWVAVTPAKESEQIIRCIVVRPDSQRQGQATRLLRALFARFPDSSWLIGSLVPEEMSELFKKVGFKNHPVTQQQMVLRFA